MVEWMSAVLQLEDRRSHDRVRRCLYPAEGKYQGVYRAGSSPARGLVFLKRNREEGKSCE